MKGDVINEAMAEVLNLNDNSAGIFCANPGCDDKFQLLVEQTA